MTKNRICATATGLPRRTFLAGAAAFPATVAAPALATTEPQDEISAYLRGFKDGQRRIAECLVNEIKQIRSDTRAKPSLIKPRMDELTKEACHLIRSIAPEGSGSIMCYLGSSWSPHEPEQMSWNARSDSFCQSALSDGKLHWICDEMKHLNPETLVWY